MIEQIRVKGYRLFKDFETKLQPGINVLIGANASGKSSLVELLRIIQSCCLGTVKPGIELRPMPGKVFHPAGEPSIAWGITVPLIRDDRPPRCYHTMEIQVPTRAPRISSEVLTELGRKGRLGDCAPRELPDDISDEPLIRPCEPHRPLGWRLREHGVISEGRPRVRLDLEDAEPLLSRLTDPRYDSCYRFRNILLRWRFYSGLNINRTSPLRLPQPMEATTELQESGDNLASVLLLLFSDQRYQDQKGDFLSFLRAAIPEFETLAPTPDTLTNGVVLQWVEKGLGGRLSAPDLSDGVLRLLALGAICCNPHPPSLICIDEPEIGLHPKVLPLVGGLLRHAAQRSQVIVLTHSPELLYGMPLESIAVMRKEDGETKIVWPNDHKLLREIVTEEVAGEREVNYERLSEAFLSGELDTLG